MERSRIEWTDSTWNPVTGCLHGCKYCYARGIAKRFGGCDVTTTYGKNIPNPATWRRLNPRIGGQDGIFEILPERPPVKLRFDKKKDKTIRSVAPYPWGFQPTLHRNHLADYKKKSARTVFVCSMGDLFGDWVPDTWLDAVFEACENGPQHRYIFLTKNPQRYGQYPIPTDRNKWYGTSVTTEADLGRLASLPETANTFASIEPLLGDLHPEDHMDEFSRLGWIILGAESGNRKEKVVPESMWVAKIVYAANELGIPVYMKDSLFPIVGDENLLAEFPWR